MGPAHVPSMPGWATERGGVGGRGSAGSRGAHAWLHVEFPPDKPPALPSIAESPPSPPVTAAGQSVARRCSQAPQTPPVWHQCCWPSLGLLPPWHWFGCVSRCPLRGFLTTNTCTRSAAKWGCSGVNCSTVCITQWGLGLLSLSFLPRWNNGQTLLLMQYSAA